MDGYASGKINMLISMAVYVRFNIISTFRYMSYFPISSYNVGLRTFVKRIMLSEIKVELPKSMEQV